MDRLYPDTNTWWVADRYEVLEGGFIRPSPEVSWPDDFTTYNPLEDYQDHPTMAPHLDLWNLDLVDGSPETIRERFVELYGLLGLGYRSEVQTTYFALARYLLQTPSSSAIEHRGHVMFRIGTSRKIWKAKRSELEKETGRKFNIIRLEPDQKTTVPHMREIYGEWCTETPSPVATFNATAALLQSYLEDIQSNHQRPRRWTEGLGAPPLVRPVLHHKRDEPGLTPEELQERAGGLGYSLSFQYRSLLDACFLMAMLDGAQSRTRKCPECRRGWRFADRDGRSDTPYCPDRNCSQRAASRKTKQRDRWEKFLQTNDPELAEQWGENHRTDQGKFQHPVDLWAQLTQREKQRAREWARRIKKYSSRGIPDPWIEPLLKEE